MKQKIIIRILVVNMFIVPFLILEEKLGTIEHIFIGTAILIISLIAIRRILKDFKKL